MNTRRSFIEMSFFYALLGGVGCTSQAQPANPVVVLPEPVKSFVDAVHREDIAAVLAYFPKDTGIVRDGSRRMVGHAAIRLWSDKEFVGAKGRISPTAVVREGNRVTLLAGWKSNYYSGNSRFVFLVEGMQVLEMQIGG